MTNKELYVVSEPIKIGAELLNAEFLPSDLVDDYPQKTYSASRVARMMEPAHAKLKDLGCKIGQLANVISKQ